jgi:outer membrane lipoprotein carrier protein
MVRREVAMEYRKRRARARLIVGFVGVAVCLPAPDAETAQPMTSAAPAATRTSAARGGASDASPRESSPADAACPEPAAVVQRLQARYDTTTAFRAAFTHVTTVAALGESEEARGTVAFKKPGRMRWDYRAPQEQLIVSDGTTLWIYQPADHQVLKAPFKAAFMSTTPVSFLAGVGRISDDFHAERDSRGCSAGRIHVKLVPKNTQDLGSLSVAVDPTTFDIIEATVTDPIGNVTVLGFADVVRNVDIPDGEFHFEVPAGVDVVAAPGAPAAP